MNGFLSVLSLNLSVFLHTEANRAFVSYNIIKNVCMIDLKKMFHIEYL